MHACLRIAEILDPIIGFMVDDTHESDKFCGIRHQDVARLARTCKLFKDPALDVLWRTQSSLSPLILCLPDHLWTIKRDPGGRVVSLREEPSHEDWFSLQRYSHRIRAFDHCSRSPHPVCTITLDTVFSPNLSQKLFPSLRTLDLEVVGYGSMFLVPHSFLVINSVSLPQLTRLTFAMSYKSPCKFPPIHFKPACAPSLQALTINVRCDRFDPMIVNFGDFPRLRSLNLSDLPFHGGWELIHLCDLTATLPNGFDINVHSSTQPILPSLQRLSVNVGTLNQVTNLLLPTTSSDLNSVKVSCCSPATQSDIHALFRAVEHVNERSPNFCTLEVHNEDCSFVTISWPILPANWEDPSYDLPRSTLAPLLACHNLRVLKLYVLGELGIDDAFVAMTALAWPDIEVLHLCGFRRYIPRVSLRGIHELLQRCQRLRSLYIQIDGTTVPEGEPEMWSLSLETLDLCGSRVPSAHEAVIRYLRILAPKLKSLRLY